MTTFELWKNKEDLEPTLKSQLDNYTEQEVHDAFYTRAEFGTAGMRGLLGPGPNRINIYTVARANIGYGKYLLSLGHENPSVAIAYDNRHKSKELAEVCAKTLSVLGIKSYVFESLRPTPELSFAVRELGCIGGIVITASHNPKEYNGYKVYDETGCQLTPEKVEKVVNFVAEIDNELEINLDEYDASLIEYIGADIDEKYINRVLGIRLRENVKQEDLSIVFTPQHGTAYPLMPEILKRAGFSKVTVVEEQLEADPDFTNTKTPNPEEKPSYDLALEYAKKVDADLILSTDPDADRMGIVVKHHDKYEYLTGNQGGTILISYILSTLKEHDRLPKDGKIYNTIVTSDAGEKLANLYGIEVEKTLTGFKYIGEKIHKSDKPFIMGYEESYGYLLADFVRDKDALQSCLMLAEAAAYYKTKGLTLVDILHQAFDNVGTYVEFTESLTLKGADGAQKIKDLMHFFRTSDLVSIGGVEVVKFEDYNNEEFNTMFPLADVLKFYLSDDSWVAIRPSGTEPKCKFYYCVKDFDEAEANRKLETYQKDINRLISEV